MKGWRLLKEEQCWPEWALSIEEAIPKTVGKGLAPNTLRFWRTRNTIIIGRFQCPKSEARFSSCLRHEASIVRRFTGGGAVYHDMGNLNFAIAMHKYSWAGGKLSDFFKKVGLTLVNGLEKLGVSANYNRMNVHVSDRKLSGFAGMVTKEAMFVHGSLLVGSNLEVLYQVLNFDEDRSRKRFVPSIVRKVTTLEDELNREMQMSEVEEVLVEAFEEEFRSVFVRGELTMEERKLAKKLFEERYSKPQWLLATCKGCPEIDFDAPILETLSLFHGSPRFLSQNDQKSSEVS